MLYNREEAGHAARGHDEGHAGPSDGGVDSGSVWSSLGKDRAQGMGGFDR